MYVRGGRDAQWNFASYTLLNTQLNSQTFNLLSIYRFGHFEKEQAQDIRAD